ncbi:hypothetical protein DJ46_5753 (plasmid) [Bacillus anthracis str. Vollum]|nr:conserved hypothetical protein [Bacillus anthracis str. CDC 684]AFH86930.1 Hypothetical Protein H9401_5545 [Bacillus anthracis str. H9401]AHK41688.1 hypothetical protein BAPAT_pXO10068 [Bacillus anthracis str. SVA11]AIK55171.1 hypothetical protein DJ44_5630 [Bacillus anthracis]AIK60975.1 hypothetical protein DJ46_5753 [Bacillus anthracis str. Vollum]AIY77394.1 hypothetical protein NT98_1294 [Bacillus cereus]AJG51138.1 hypothetical protein AS53_5738 [Bacillus anthracis str. Turkey32]AJH432
MRKNDLVAKPFFETLGKRDTTYFVYGYRTAKPKLHLGEFNSSTNMLMRILNGSV